MNKYFTIGCEFGWENNMAAREERFEYVIVYNNEDLPEKKLRKAISQFMEKLYKIADPNIYCARSHLIGVADIENDFEYLEKRLAFLGEFTLLDFKTKSAQCYQTDGTIRDITEMDSAEKNE